MSFVLRHKETKVFAAGRGAYSMVDDLQSARVYGRSCDAKNSRGDVNYEVVPVWIVPLDQMAEFEEWRKEKAAEGSDR